MEKGDQSAKKARLEPLPITRVKQEVGEHEGTGGKGGGGGAVVVVAVAAESGPKVEGAIKMDMSLLQCPLCSRPLKPPVFQCKAGHLACGGCIAGGEECGKCEHGGGAFDVRNTAMDAVVSAVMVECPHGGCVTHVAYHELGDHLGACPHAPCLCTEPGCGFTGLPPALAAHLFAEHAWPKLTVQYGKVYRLRVPVPSRRVLVSAGDDGGAFVLTAGALGAATAVSVVCVRAHATESPRYMCKMWANFPVATGANGGKPDVALVEMKLESSTSPSAVVAVNELVSFLTVPPRYLVPGAAAVSSMAVPLSIRIEKISSSS